MKRPPNMGELERRIREHLDEQPPTVHIETRVTTTSTSKGHNKLAIIIGGILALGSIATLVAAIIGRNPEPKQDTFKGQTTASQTYNSGEEEYVPCKKAKVLRQEYDVLADLFRQAGKKPEAFDAQLDYKVESGHITTMWIGEPGFTSIPSSLSNLKKLKSLNIMYIGISGSNLDGICGLSNLESLSFGQSHIRTLPACINNLTNLHALDVDGGVENLPDMSGLRNLTTLTLDHNNLTSLHYSLAQLPNIKSVYIPGNNLPSNNTVMWQLYARCVDLEGWVSAKIGFDCINQPSCHYRQAILAREQKCGHVP